MRLTFLYLFVLFIFNALSSHGSDAWADCTPVLECAQAAATAAAQAQAAVKTLSEKLAALQASSKVTSDFMTSLQSKVFTKGGNNGAASCDQICSDVAAGGKSGWCLGGTITKGPKTGSNIGCSLTPDTYSGVIGGKADTTCFCLSPP